MCSLFRFTLLCLAPVLINAEEPKAVGTNSTLAVPAVSPGAPSAGKRVRVTPPEYKGTKVHHTLYLPRDWSSDSEKRWPVIVEYTGNRFPASGSTGRVEDARLGYGVSGGNSIWVVLPFVNTEGEANAVRWWGDELATVEYAKRNVPRICKRYRGDPRRVILCGFSRGAIAVSYIGLHDDAVAKLWSGFMTHDHFDGVRQWRGTAWGTPLGIYRAAATERLKRLRGRPLLVCQSPGTEDVRAFLAPRVKSGVTLLDVDTRGILGAFPNSIAKHPHTDGWLLVDSDARKKVWAWVETTAR